MKKTKIITHYEDTQFGPMRTGETREVSYIDDDKLNELEKEIRRKLKWVNKRGKDFFDRKIEGLSFAGAWQKGHYEGIQSVLEDLMDIIDEEWERKTTKSGKD